MVAVAAFETWDKAEGDWEGAKKVFGLERGGGKKPAAESSLEQTSGQ